VRYFVFDEVGNQLRSIDELGKTTYFTYDGLDRQTHVKDQAAAVTYTGYDSRSSMVLRLDADNRSTYMGYDAAARRTALWFAAPSSPDTPIYYGYDTVGNMTTVQDNTVATANYFTFDRLDRLTKEFTTAGAVYYAYDKAGLKARLKDPALNETYYGYDVASRLAHAQLLDGTPRAQYYEYDGSGMLVKKASPQNRVLTYYNYDNAGRQSQILARDNAGDVISYFAYTRLENGLASIVLREDDGLTAYGWDQLDRLVSEQQYTPFPSSLVYSVLYSYDAASNRIRKTDALNSLPTYYGYDSRNLIYQERFKQGVVFPTNYYAFDASQRMTQQYTDAVATTPQAFYYSYNQRNMATQIVNKQSGADLPRYFRYNGVGEAVAVVDTNNPALPTSYWTFDGSKLIADSTPGGTTTAYRHNQSQNARESFIEYAAGASHSGSPVVDERGSVYRGKGLPPGSDVDETFAYSFFGENIGATGGAVDQRARFGQPVHVRLTSAALDLSIAVAGRVYVHRIALFCTGPLQLLLQDRGTTPTGTANPNETRKCKPVGIVGKVAEKEPETLGGVRIDIAQAAATIVFSVTFSEDTTDTKACKFCQYVHSVTEREQGALGGLPPKVGVGSADLPLDPDFERTHLGADGKVRPSTPNCDAKPGYGLDADFGGGFPDIEGSRARESINYDPDSDTSTSGVSITDATRVDNRRDPAGPDTPTFERRTTSYVLFVTGTDGSERNCAVSFTLEVRKAMGGERTPSVTDIKECKS